MRIIFLLLYLNEIRTSKNSVFARFRDIQMGDLNPAIDKNGAISILNLFSALQPVKFNDSKLIDKISETVNIDRITLISIIYGSEISFVVLLNKRNLVRITLDVFSDYLLGLASRMVDLPGMLKMYSRNFLNIAQMRLSQILPN